MWLIKFLGVVIGLAIAGFGLYYAYLIWPVEPVVEPDESLASTEVLNSNLELLKAFGICVIGFGMLILNLWPKKKG